MTRQDKAQFYFEDGADIKEVMIYWIPTSYCCPDDDTLKLVTCRTKQGMLSVNRAYYDGQFWHGSGSMSGVIAWADMPPGYGEDNR